jgi:hypothetical protein
MIQVLLSPSTHERFYAPVKTRSRAEIGALRALPDRGRQERPAEGRGAASRRGLWHARVRFLI